MHDFERLVKRQQEVWSSGDFAAIGVEHILVGERLCEFVPVHAGDRVLDVATGSGNTALAAARRRASVIGIDFVPALLERGRQRASAEGLCIEFQEGNAMALPFADGSFDVVTSSFGAMFGPDPQQIARELARVCRPGGKIAMANWAPDGMIGEFSRLTARYAPPPGGIEAPTLWGDEAVVRERLGGYCGEIRFQRQVVRTRALSAEAWLEHSRRYFGPTIQTFAKLDESASAALAAEMIELVKRFNRAENGTILAEGVYLEVVGSVK